MFCDYFGHSVLLRLATGYWQLVAGYLLFSAYKILSAKLQYIIVVCTANIRKEYYHPG